MDCLECSWRIACVDLVRERRHVLPYTLEVVAFCDEEALRYPFPYLGSRVFTGDFDEAELQVADTEGVTLAAGHTGHRR